MFGNVRDIIDETSNIQTTTNNWVAELGNGLVDSGSLSEDAWKTKDENQRPKGKYFQGKRIKTLRENEVCLRVGIIATQLSQCRS